MIPNEVSYETVRAGFRWWLSILLCVAVVGGVVPVATAGWEVLEEVDVLVVGGTPAGIAAAVAAARFGRTVALVEPRPFLGGVLTGAMLSTFDLSLGPDGRDSIGGIFAEVYRELGIAFDPWRARAFFQEFVGRERGIRLLVGTRLLAPLVEDGRAVGAVLEGFRSVRARVVVDATDDADYAAAAGATYTLGREESGIDRAMQAATLMFRLRGVSWPRVVAYLRRYEKPARRGGVYHRVAWGYSAIVERWVSPDPRVAAYDLNLSFLPDGTVWVNALQVFGVDGTRKWSRWSGYARAKRVVPEFVEFLRQHAPGFEEATVVEVAPELYIRETRHVRGLYTLTASDVVRGRRFWDRIAAAAYPIDLHPYTPGWMNPYRTRRFHFTVPLRSLVVRDVDNLFVASRSFSATYQAAGAARVVPVTMALGQAAGVAASVCVEHGVSPHALVRRHDLVALVQWRLQSLGARITHRTWARLPRADPKGVSSGGFIRYTPVGGPEHHRDRRRDGRGKEHAH